MDIIIAIIEGTNYGLRDFPDGRPGLWFSVHWDRDETGGGYAALMAYQHDEAEMFLIKNNVQSILDLNGRQCLISDQNGKITFISLAEKDIVEGTIAEPVRIER